MTSINNDVKAIPEDAPTELLFEKHIDFLVGYGKGDTHYEFVMAEFLRINGVYWSYTALQLMHAESKLNKEEVSKMKYDFLFRIESQKIFSVDCSIFARVQMRKWWLRSNSKA